MKTLTLEFITGSCQDGRSLTQEWLYLDAKTLDDYFREWQHCAGAT
jgi:hypothetical protein